MHLICLFYFSGTVVLKYKLEPVRPVPTLTLTDEQKSILIKKKQSFNDIKLIQQICGTSNLSPFKHVLEFKRKQQHANTRGNKTVYFLIFNVAHILL